MLSRTVARPSLQRWKLAFVVVTLIALMMTSLAGTASAHGSTSDPPSRTYHCHFNTDRFDPNLPETDPMCAQAWEAEPQALYDWMALLTTEGDTPYEDFIPDGEICSAGLDKYAAFDEPGPWTATEIDNDFTLTFTANAPHETEFYRVFVTRQGFDPTTDELTWDDLELVFESGQLPAAPEDTFEISAPGRTGRHIVYLQWRRLPDHSPETFYACSDVIFPGGEGDEPADPPADEPSEDAPEDPTEASTVTPDEPADDPAGPEDPAEPAPGEAGDNPAQPDEPAEPAPTTPDEGGTSSIIEFLLSLLSDLFARFAIF